jgi:glutamate transport system substrate-binding protein
MTVFNTRTARVSATALAVLLTAGLSTACSSSGGSNSPGGSGGSGGSSNAPSMKQVLAKAPVADASSLGKVAKAIHNRGKLKVGSTDTSPLFSFKDPTTNKYTGFDALMTEMLAKYIIGKPKVSHTQVTVPTRETLLENHSVDVVVATYTITPQREKLVSFAGPYFEDGDAILVRKDQSGINKPADLNGKKICTENGSTAAQDIKKFAPKVTVLLLDKNDQCLQALEQKRVVAYVLDQSIVGGDALQNPDKVKVVGKTFTKEPYGIGVPKDQPQFKKFVNAWLKKIFSDGSWKQLWEATIGKAIGGHPPKPPKIGSADGS